jgi:hypothetical protein
MRSATRNIDGVRSSPHQRKDTPSARRRARQRVETRCAQLIVATLRRLVLCTRAASSGGDKRASARLCCYARGPFAVQHAAYQLKQLSRPCRLA